jgi:hypothetical protein
MRVLVTGVGGSAGQNLVACLRLAGHSIVGVDANQYHLAAADADKRYLVPPTEQLEAWLDLMRHLARGVDVILPQPDCDVWALATNRHLFEGQLRLPDTKAVEICQDKLKTAEVLGEQAVVTRQWTGYVNGSMAELGSPLWLRARTGAGGRGSMKAYTSEQASAWVQYCEQAKGIDPAEFLVCEFLPGAEFAVQQIWNGGRLIVSQARERVEYLFGYLSPTGQTSTPAVARTVRRADVTAQANLRPGVSGDSALEYARKAPREGYDVTKPVGHATIPIGESAIVTMHRKDESGAATSVRKLFQVRFDKLYVLTYTVPAAREDETMDAFMKLTGSIKWLTPEETVPPPTPRIALATAKEGETWKSIAQERLGGDWRAARLAAWNGRDAAEAPTAGMLIKIPPVAAFE